MTARRWWQRKPMIGILVGVGIALLLGFTVFGSLYRAFSITSGGMKPNLLPGDVLVFEFPLDRDQDYIKRCVAVAGDTVEMRDGILFVNGAIYESALDDPAADHSCLPGPANGSDCPEPHTLLNPSARRQGQFNHKFGPLVVPEGHLFMMGDSRYNSRDSRYWGTLPRELVHARAAFFYWSWDPHGGLRGDRLLRRVR